MNTTDKKMIFNITTFNSKKKMVGKYFGNWYTGKLNCSTGSLIAPH
jgi:hypothetical protein